MYQSAKLIASCRSQGLGSELCNFAKLYCSDVHLKLDYGCAVYGSARQSVLESLDRLHNDALCTCLGEFRTSPVSSLHVEVGERPHELRRQQLVSIIYI